MILVPSSRNARSRLASLALAGLGLALTATACAPPPPTPPAQLDGTIVFVSERTGDDELYAMDGDGTGVERLTVNPGPDRAPTWDPTGEQLVFNSRRAPHDTQPELYRLDFAQRLSTRLTDNPLEDQRGTFTPDGAAVVFQRGNFVAGFGLWRQDLATGDEQLLVSWPGKIASAPSISPDGTTLVFQSNHESTGIFPFRLYTLDLQTLAVSPFFHAATGSDDGPRWSPDGRTVAFSSSRSGTSSLYVAEPATGSLRQVTDDEGSDISPAWSPEGDRLVFQSDRVVEDGGVHVVDLRSGRLSFRGEGRTPVWSPTDRDNDGL
jgi:Tol biopolymer transport system component